ncbi:MAG: hypothetical protein GX639_12560 [Fibrobacter sp.]|nr:hypothetical protein [Fibrobacter sp.]
MTKRINTFSLLLLCASLTLCISCGTSSIAGGAGTGNPGKTTFAIIAQDTTPAISLGKATDVTDIIIPDSINTFFNVTSSFIIVKRIHFIYNPEDKPDAMTLIPPLRIDNESVVLEGPFTFNTLTGISDSLLGFVLLPDANYTGVRIVIENKPNKNSIFLSGTFRHQNIDYPFRFDLSLNVTVNYDHNSQVYISGTDSTDIKVVLDASKWLSNINIGNCISSQPSPFDSNGTFVLNGKITEGVCAEIPRKINENIIKSGRLKVKQVKIKKAP